MVEYAHYEVLKGLHENMNITEISKYRKVSRTSIYKMLATISKKGLVKNISKGVWEITEKGRQGLHSFVGMRYKLRQHNLGIKIKILESPKNWKQKRNELRFLPYFNQTIKLKNNEQDLLNFGKLQIRTTSKSIIIKMPTIYAKNWEQAVIESMQIFEDKIFQIEKLFKIKLIKDFKANITFISQEYARLQDALAKLYRHEGNRIYLTGEDGKIWLITDFSFSTDELELIHPNQATEDVGIIAPFMNDLRKNPITLTEMREETKQVLQVAKAHAININKHQKVLDEILKAFNKINKRLDEAGL